MTTSGTTTGHRAARERLHVLERTDSPTHDGRVVDRDHSPDPTTLLARDADAWAALYRSAAPGLHAYAARRLPGGAAAEDAVSETLARALVGIGRFDAGSGSVSAWLFGILRNVVAEQHRRIVRDAAPPAAPVPPETPGPLQQLLAAERDAQLRAAFEQLSSADRELLELRVVGGLGTTEIAAVLGRREGAVRMAQSRALARLRRRWEEVGYGQD